MENRPKDDGAAQTAADQRTPIDPLRRVFIPIERKQSDGTVRFKTHDKREYERRADGSIRRIHPREEHP